MFGKIVRMFFTQRSFALQVVVWYACVALSPALGNLGYCARWLGNLFQRSNKPIGRVISSLAGQDLDALVSEIQTDPIVRIESFPASLERGTEEKYIAYTESGLKLIIKPRQMGDGPVEPSNFPQPRFEAAVYRLSRILGIDRVPPTVVREAVIDGRRVTVSAQLWIDNSRPYSSRWRDWFHTTMLRRNPNPFQRQAESRSKTDQQQRQVEQLFLLDFLANVHDRHGRNALLDTRGNIVAIDNGLAFHSYEGETAPSIDAINLDGLTLAQLRTLSRESLRPLDEYLTEREIQFILSRRDRLLVRASMPSLQPR